MEIVKISHKLVLVRFSIIESRIFDSLIFRDKDNVIILYIDKSKMH